MIALEKIFRGDSVLRGVVFFLTVKNFSATMILK